MKKLLATLFALFLLNPATVFAEEEPLPQEQAFPMTASATDANTIIAEWKVADTYYLYHNKFSFRTNTAGITLGTPVIPSGKIKKDPYFGNVETLRGTVRIEIPITRNNNDISNMTLITSSQGCADMGLCYPPFEQTVQIKLINASATSAGTNIDPLQAITELGNNMGLEEEEEFLDPDKAFMLSTKNGDNQSLIAHWMIADKYYMYRDKFKVKLKNAPEGISIGKFEMPEGETKQDEYFGEIKVYHNAITIQIPIIGDLKGKTAEIELVYQGCAEAGLCYPPTFKTVTYDPANEVTSTVASASTTPTTTQSMSTEGMQDDEVLGHLFRAEHLPTILLALLGFGLLLAFTACMYPMIPIVSSIIIGHGEKVTATKGFMLSLIYVLSMALTFGVIGAIFGYTGEASNIAAQMQKPWVLILFSSLFVILALSMFGFYNIQIPSALQSRLNEISNRQKGGSLIGVAVMGVLSALIIGPCGGPVLIATIAGAAASNDPVLGFLYMFTLAMGMGAPLLVVGAGGGKILPHAGTWMDNVKAAAGVLLLGLAIIFLERVLSSTIYMIMWATLFMVSAIYMGAFAAIAEGSSGWRKLFKGLGLVAFVYGVIILLGGLTGARNFNDPLHGSSLTSNAPGMMMMNTSSNNGTQPAYVEFAKGKKSVVKGGLTFIKVKTVADFKRELKTANAAGNTVMLDFYADWCTYCKQFDDYVFSDQEVQQSLSNTVLIQADITLQDNEDKELLKYVKVITAPAILFYKTDGIEVRKQRVLGLMKASEFLNRVNKSFN
ncbi:MAG: protein-disulfide reductase DsbD [Gammaproteobacteria bacterium]|nr:protein-disulfide reductase DsbD [Gammaproteobacteria bacterium]